MASKNRDVISDVSKRLGVPETVVGNVYDAYIKMVAEKIDSTKVFGRFDSKEEFYSIGTKFPIMKFGALCITYERMILMNKIRLWRLTRKK